MERKHLKKSFSAHVRWCEHGAPVNGGQETKSVRFLHKLMNQQLVQLGCLCLCLIRQTLPGRFQLAPDANLVNV